MDAQKMQEIRSAIINNGWKQGKLVSSNVVDFKSLIFLRPFNTDSITHCLVISQTCDIVQPKLEKEPLVECLPISSLDKPDMLKVNGRNSREYHFEHEGMFYSVDIWNTCFIDKQFLIDADIKNEMELSEKLIAGIAQWKARRYIRVAWPDSFHHRAKSFFKSKKWKRFVVKNSDLFHGIYLSISPRGETDEEYLVSFKFVLLNEDSSSELVEELIDDTEELLGYLDSQEGIRCLNLYDEFIEIENTVVLRSEFSILDMQSYLRWQDDDFHSANPDNIQDVVNDQQ